MKGKEGISCQCGPTRRFEM